MKQVVHLFLAAFIMFALAACSDDRPVLRIYNWGDYLSQDVIDAFESEYNCKIELDTFDSNEAMYAKLAAGAAGYDIVVPSSYMAKPMFDQGMLEKLDHSKLPNIKKYFDTKYSALNLDPQMAYSVPYFVSFTGIGYDTKYIKDFEPTWKMFERSDLKGKTSLLDDQREVLGCALRTLGYSTNETDPAKIAEAVSLARTWKQQIARFGVDDTKQSLATGEFWMIQTYSGDMLQVIEEVPTVKFVIPAEGSTVTFDNMAIMKDSKNKDLAYKFIDFLYRPEIAVMNMNEIQYIMPHNEAVGKVDEAIRSNPAFNIPEEDFKRCIPLQDLGDKNKLYNDAWDRIKQE